MFNHFDIHVFSIIFNYFLFRNANVIPLDYKATFDSNLYEDIEKYHICDIASNEEQDISPVACPTYVTVPSTDKKPVSTGESEYETV